MHGGRVDYNVRAPRLPEDLFFRADFLALVVAFLAFPRLAAPPRFRAGPLDSVPKWPRYRSQTDLCTAEPLLAAELPDFLAELARDDFAARAALRASARVIEAVFAELMIGRCIV